MALETVDKLHAIAQVVPVVFPPFTRELLSADGFASFTRNSVGNYTLLFNASLAFSEGYAEASLSANVNMIVGAQILEDGSGVLVTVQDLDGLPREAPFFGVKVWATRQGEGPGPAVPPPGAPLPAAAPAPPVGSVVLWVASIAVPPNWLTCDGTAVSRSTFAVLFATLGELYGPGDGTTTFNLPDMRGRFIRALDQGAGIDPNAATRTAPVGGLGGDNVGTTQADEFDSHNHQAGAGPTPQGSFGLVRAAAAGEAVTASAFDISPGEPDLQRNPENIPLEGGLETRPVNFAAIYIISAGA